MAPVVVKQPGVDAEAQDSPHNLRGGLTRVGGGQDVKALLCEDPRGVGAPL